MRPLTQTTPKPLLKVGGKTLLERLVSNFPDEISELIVVHGYLGEKIVNYCGDKFCGRRVRYVHQPVQRGTYDALALTRKYLDDNESFGVFYADDLIDKKTFRECIKYKLAAIVVKVADPKRFGVVTLNDDGSIKNIIEKPEHPESDLVLVSGFVLNPVIFNYPPLQNPNGEYYLSEAVAKMSKEHKIFTVKAYSWIPVGVVEDLKKAEALFS